MGAASLTLKAEEGIHPPFSIALTSDDGNGLVSQMIAPMLLAERISPQTSAIAKVNDQ
jgi:hypothetical protein